MTKFPQKKIYKKYIFITITIITTMCLIQGTYIKDNVEGKIYKIRSETVDNNYILYKDPAQPVELRVEDLINRMTLEEKIREMYGFKNEAIPYLVMFLPLIRPRYSNTRLEIPAFTGANGPMGLTFYGTTFPVGTARGGSWDPQLEYDINVAIGKEAKSIGFNLFYSPTINIVRHPCSGRALESYSESTFHTGQMGVSAVKGLQKNIISQVKHYAGYNIEENRSSKNIKIDERTLREVYLPHFKAAVEKGNVASVMSAYNKLNDYNMSENKHLLKDILKDEWEFDGFVASDWFAEGNTINCVSASLDIQMPIPTFYGDSLLNLVKKGDVSESAINESVKRVLRKKFEFGLFDNFVRCNLIDFYKDKKKNRELALESAQESMVLLKNENSLLPINRNEVSKIAVIGPYANQLRLGDYNCEAGLKTNPITPLKGIKNKAGNIHVKSYTGNIKELAKLTAKSADVAVVVVGLTIQDEGEKLTVFGSPVGGDREQLGLSNDDIELIKAVSEVNDNVVVVIQVGSSITMENWIDDVESILMAWYPGIEGGNAIGNILFGNVNPSGKLPITFPKSLDQLYPFGFGEQEVEFEYYHGYRYFDKYDLEPLFPFGFGLSYTNYSYSDITLNKSIIRKNDSLSIYFNITNIGSMSGKEIAQLYIGYNNSSVDRAVRDLKGFKKVFLEPGETKKVCINISAQDLAYYNVNINQWIVEPITYKVEVGRSSRSLPLHTEFIIKN